MLNQKPSNDPQRLTMPNLSQPPPTPLFVMNLTTMGTAMNRPTTSYTMPPPLVPQNFAVPPPFQGMYSVPPPPIVFTPQMLPPPLAAPPPPPQLTQFLEDISDDEETEKETKSRKRPLDKDDKVKKKKRKSEKMEKTSKEKSLGTTLFALAKETRLRQEKQKNTLKPNSPEMEKIEPEIATVVENETIEKKDLETEERSRGKDTEFCRLTEEDFANWDEDWVEEIDKSEKNIDNENKMQVKPNLERATVVDWERFYTILPNAESSLSEQISEKFRLEVRQTCAMERGKRVEVPRPASPAMHAKCKCGAATDDESSSESDDDEKESTLSTSIQQEVERKRNHPASVSREIAFNEAKQGNDGPLCRCSSNAAKKGIRHGHFAGEKSIPKCDGNSSLYHYYLRVTPLPSNALRNTGPFIHETKQYNLEGFSVYLHEKLPNRFPKMPLTTFGPEHSFELLKDEDNVRIGSVQEMELFRGYLFEDVMELVDEWRFPSESDTEMNCPVYHIAPRYVHRDKTSTYLLPLSIVLAHYTCRFQTFLASSLPPIGDEKTQKRLQYELKDSIVINPIMRPAALRIDRIEGVQEGAALTLKVVHVAQRPTAYTLHGRPEYQKTMRKLTRLKRMFRNRRTIPTQEEKDMVMKYENEIARYDSESIQRKETFVQLPIAGYRNTGIRSDMIHHGLLFVLAMHHIRYHWSLQLLEERMGYHFQDRSLVELAFTHPSFRKNFGQNPDHARNVFANLGIRMRPQIPNHEWNKKNGARKKGLNSLQFTMSREGSKKIEQSFVNHNERLEFLGDAVVEFMTTVHLYFCFPRLQEGGLATFRTALVQNRNLAQLAGRLGLDSWMLFSHGPDLCHEADMKHAMANAFEALMAAVFLDGGIDHCDRIFSEAMFSGDEVMRDRWVNVPEHSLKVEHPDGDRHLIDSIPALRKLSEFEDTIGLRFEHIRLLAKAFTRRSVPMNDLTRGHNQRLEFLGDSVLQLIVSDFLYKHFPGHHEGHLSLLRTCLVSNSTLSIICDDLSLTTYLIEPPRRSARLQPLKTKDKADLVEALIGAIYVDRGWDYCRVICRVCFFPRLKYFIRNDNWNDPKSRLQQACLALRAPGEAPIPIYKKISENGPTNTRRFEVTVSFKGERLAMGVGSTVQLAEMNAAEKALEIHAERFRLMTEKGRVVRGMKVELPKQPPVSLMDLKLEPLLPDTSLPPPLLHSQNIQSQRSPMIARRLYPNAQVPVTITGGINSRMMETIPRNPLNFNPPPSMSHFSMTQQLPRPNLGPPNSGSVQNPRHPH